MPSESPYDPYIPAGQPVAARKPNATADIQLKLDEAAQAMRDNIRRVEQRSENLDNLHQKTDGLAESAGQFRRGANQVRKKMWWKDMKMRIWLIIGIIVLLALIIIPSVMATRNK